MIYYECTKGKWTLQMMVGSDMVTLKPSNSKTSWVCIIGGPGRPFATKKQRVNMPEPASELN